MVTGNQRGVPRDNDQSGGNRPIAKGRRQAEEEEGAEKAVITSYTYVLATQL